MAGEGELWVLSGLKKIDYLARKTIVPEWRLIMCDRGQRGCIGELRGAGEAATHEHLQALAHILWNRLFPELLPQGDRLAIRL